jgi:hypothetical protein
MATFTIRIIGIAIVYPKGEEWKVIFPFDDCHQIRFTDGRNYNNTPLALAERTIEFTTPVTASQFGKGKGYDDFLDITANYAHFPQTLRKKADWPKHGVIMTIPNAVFSSLETNNSRYKLIEPGGGERRGFKKNSLSYYGKAVTEAGKLTMNISGYGPEEYPESATLIFDNGCYREAAEEEHGDFKLIYNIVKDIRTDGLEFDVIRHPGDTFRQGALGPRESNPNPGIKGLPCHMVTIGQPADLLDTLVN